MVGEALKLGHQRAQIMRSRRRIDVQGGFDRSRKSDPVSHGTVARGAGGEPRAAFERGACHQRFDAFVRVAKALFQTGHRLAGCREAEVPGLYDPGMHRSNRNLM